MQDPVDPRKHQPIHHQRYQRDDRKGQRRALPQSLRVPPSELDGEISPRTHAQSQQDRGQKHHQRIGAAHRRQCVRAEKTSHDQRVRNIIDLLEQVARHHWQGKFQQFACNTAPGQIGLHKNHPIVTACLSRISPFSSERKFYRPFIHS